MQQHGCKCEYPCFPLLEFANVQGDLSAIRACSSAEKIALCDRDGCCPAGRIRTPLANLIAITPIPHKKAQLLGTVKAVAASVELSVLWDKCGCFHKRPRCAYSMGTYYTFRRVFQEICNIIISLELQCELRRTRFFFNPSPTLLIGDFYGLP